MASFTCARRGRDRGDHQLHQHVEPIGHACRGAAGEEGGRAGPQDQALGEDQPRAGLQGRDRLLRKAGLLERSRRLGFNIVGYGCTTCIGNSGPLPAGDRRRRRARRPGRGAPCSPATATSRAGSIRESRSTTWRRRRWSWPTRWPGSMDIDLRPSRWAPAREGKPVFLTDIWPTPRDVEAAILRSVDRRCSANSTPRSSPATSAGRAPVPEGDRTRGTPRRTSRTRRTSTA